MCPRTPSSRRNASALAWLLILGLGLGLGCKRSPSGDLAVGELIVSDANLAGNPELGETADNVRRELKEALEATGRFVVKAGADSKLRLEIESARRLIVPPPVIGQGAAPDREMAEVQLSLELFTNTAQGDVERTLAEGQARRPTGSEGGIDLAIRLAAFDAALDAALHEAVVALTWQLEARKKTDAALIADLAAPDARVRDYAVRALSDRRNPAAVGALLLRLQDDSPVVVRRTVGALVAIGDMRAVRPLIDLTKKRSPALVAEILYALGSLGGPEAESFLYTLESGSPDEEVRRAASEALSDLRRKREEAAALKLPSSPAPQAKLPRPGTP